MPITSAQILSSLVKPFASQATLKWILDNRLPTPGHRRYFNAVSEIDRIVFRIIAERRASGYDEGDLLSMLLQAQDDDGTQMSDAQLRDEVMTLFLAGHETTALALSWSWYLLATHPEAEKKFHAELDEVLGGRAPNCFGSAEAEVHGDDCERDDATCIRRRMRLAARRSRRRRLAGYRVPKGTQLFAFQWVTHRDPRYFDEPDAFKPERWTQRQRADTEVCLLPFWRWSTAVYWKLLCDDGDRVAARDDWSAVQVFTRSGAQG